MTPSLDVPHIGIVVAAHQDLGGALLRAAEGIVGPIAGTRAVSLGYDVSPETCRERISKAVREVAAGAGVLVFTDMFGGTPTNLSLPFLDPGKVEVLAGANLPMILKAQSARTEMTLGELAAFLRDYGRRNIMLASEIWNARPAMGSR